MPQDNLYVVIWETDFEDFLNPTFVETDSTGREHDQSGQQDRVLTDVDFRSPRLEQNTDGAHGQPDQETITADHHSASPVRNDGNNPTESAVSDSGDMCLDDQKLSGGAIQSCPM